jgi:hypothetical protein
MTGISAGLREARTVQTRRRTMTGFEPIDALALSDVTGGAPGDPPPQQSCTTTTLSGGLGPLRGEYKSQSCKTNEVQCAEDVARAGGSATDVLKCYGPPAGSSQPKS